VGSYWDFRRELWRLDLEPTAKLVLEAIADFADDIGGSCYPSRERIAWKTNLGVRQVQRIMARLIELGVLVPEGSRRRGRSRPAQYRIIVPENLLRSEFQKAGHSYVPLSELAHAESGTFEAESGTFDAEKRDIAMSYDPPLTDRPEETPKDDPVLLAVVRAALPEVDRADIASVSRVDGTVSIAFTRPELAKRLLGPGYQSSIGRALRAELGPVRMSFVALLPPVMAVSSDVASGM
jgi:hypothetical protein